MSTAPKSEVLHMAELVSYNEGSVVSRQITKAEAGNVTLFAFDRGEGLSEHTAPYDAVVQILDGTARITIGAEDKIAAMEKAGIRVSPSPSELGTTLDALLKELA